jgi:hypothetical protein
MSKASEQRKLLEEAPLYVRWGPERVPFAIEMRLDLVARVRAEIARGNRLDLETGGVLVGSLPSPGAPTLRIDEFIPVPRRAGDGQVFMLDPAEHERFAQVRWLGVAPEKTAVGFFRSHLRPGPLRPSIADRGLLSEHFRDVYALLLVEGREPNRAAFFVAASRELPDEPSVREFRFDEEEFKSLPEIQPPEDEDVAADQERPVRWRPWWAALFAFVLLGCAVLVWALFGAGAGSGEAGVDLSIRGAGAMLTVRWNHHARDVVHATRATLAIVDGASRREIDLGPDDLLLGAVDYQHAATRVEADLALKMPNGSTISESAGWNGK